MITNLAFKRTQVIEGSEKEEVKFVEIYIPNIKKSEGWTLVGMVDAVSIVKPLENASTKVDEKVSATENNAKPIPESRPLPDTFPSPFKTNRMMVRTGDCIRVVNRKSDNTSYNAVSISEVEKVEFYKSFRSKNPDPQHATKDAIVITKDDVVVDVGYGTQPYTFWDNFMKQRYKVEQQEHIKTISGGTGNE